MTSAATSPLQFRIATPMNPGALAVFDIIGDIESILPRLMRLRNGKTVNIPVGKIRLVDFLDVNGEIIDTGIVARPSKLLTQIMPHGGLRIIRKIVEMLVTLGVTPITPDDWSPDLWPEAESFVEALMLETLATAQSADAVDLLLAQPTRWELFYDSNTKRYRVTASEWDLLQRRSHILTRLNAPPMVVITGPANTGKSTLTNALTGRSTSITLDQPGTTRDFVGSYIDLAGLTVWWYDTPGVRHTEDVIEKQALELSRHIIDRADLLIEVWSPDVSHESQFDYQSKGRPCDLRVMLKADLLPSSENKTQDYFNNRDDASTSLAISAQTGEGVAEFVQVIRERLVPKEVYDDPLPFIFDDRMLSMIDIAQ